MSRKFNAMLGLGALAAFGFASSAFAQCPSSPVPPWSATGTLGGAVAIVAGGFDSTSCRLDSTLTANGPGTTALVRDDTPEAEPRYRAQFLIDADSLTGLNGIQSARIFSASTATGYLSRTEIVRLGIIGNLTGTTKQLNVQVVNEGGAGNISAGNVNLSAGVNRIEIDWDQAQSTLRVWVNNGNEASADLTLVSNSANWGGVDFAALGLANPSPQFRANQLNRAVGFDEFDSRRSTFIGL